METIPSLHIGGYIAIKDFKFTKENEEVVSSVIRAKFIKIARWFAFKLELGENIKNNFHFQFYIHLKKEIPFTMVSQLIPGTYTKVKYYKSTEDVVNAIAYIFKEHTQSGPIHVMNQTLPLDDCHGDMKYMEPTDH